MAKIYKTNGEILEVEPKNGTDFLFEELRDIVGGFIEVVWLPDGRLMVINENGKILKLPPNENATLMFQKMLHKYDYIVGDALVCDGNQVK